MFQYIWPVILVVFSNTVYQVCTKGVPENMNPFASLIITYLVGAAASLIMFFVLGNSRNILAELKKTNWIPFVLGLVIVGLEVGFIYAYKAGWKISTAQIVTSSILGVILIFVGYIGYKESITWNKIVGYYCMSCGTWINQYEIGANMCVIFI